MEKRFLDRRLELMTRGRHRVPDQRQRRRRRPGRRAAGASSTRSCSPAARRGRAICRCPAASSTGIHFAMEYLTLQNRRNEGDTIADERFITAKDKHVIIIGGGDTGADCLGTAHRQGARSVHQLELLPRPPDDARRRAIRGRCGRTSSASRRRTKKAASGSTRSPPQRFTGDDDGRVTTLHARQGRDGQRRTAASSSSRCPAASSS